MSPRDVAAPALLPAGGNALERSPWRAARAGTRVASLGFATLDAARRIRSVRDVPARDAARERALVLRDVARRVLELHGVCVEASGPLPLGPVVLVSNHVSWLDPIVIASRLPCAPVSKLDVARWPIIGALARELGVVFVSRGDPSSGARALQAAGAALARGVSVLNFPEGTTTLGAKVLPFRPGLFGLAARLRVPIVPVAVAYDPPSAWVGDAAFLPHYLTLACRPRTRAALRFGASIAPDAGAPAELARTAHREVSRLLEGT